MKLYTPHKITPKTGGLKAPKLSSSSRMFKASRFKTSGSKMKFPKVSKGRSAKIKI